MTTLCWVKNRTASRPCPWSVPKNDSLAPPNGKYAIGAATPTLIPRFPQRTRDRNSRAVAPLCVKIDAAFPKTLP